MPSIEYTIKASRPGAHDVIKVVYSHSIANYWVKFFEFLGYTVVKTERDLI